MNVRYRLVVLTAGMVLAVSFAMAQMPGPFSADLKTSGGPRAGEGTGKMYFGGSKFRMDMQSGGREHTIIADLPHKVSYMLMPQQHMYMEMRADQIPGRQQPRWNAYDASNPCANEPNVTCKKVGMEVVNGRPCDKWQFTSGGKSDRTTWIDQKNHIPVKTVMGDYTYELTNIQEGPQPASLFEIPAGYQKMDMGGMMRGMRPPE